MSDEYPTEDYPETHIEEANRIWKLIRTCYACPEQYDVVSGELTAYLRLRHGHFTARVPDASGELVYEAYPKGDGLFDDCAERDHFLRKALRAINRAASKEAEIGVRAASAEDILSKIEDITRLVAARETFASPDAQLNVIEEELVSLREMVENGPK